MFLNLQVGHSEFVGKYQWHASIWWPLSPGIPPYVFFLKFKSCDFYVELWNVTNTSKIAWQRQQPSIPCMTCTSYESPQWPVEGKENTPNWQLQANSTNQIVHFNVDRTVQEYRSPKYCILQSSYPRFDKLYHPIVCSGKANLTSVSLQENLLQSWH